MGERGPSFIDFAKVTEGGVGQLGNTFPEERYSPSPLCDTGRSIFLVTGKSPSKLDVKPQRGRKYGTAIAIVTRIGDILRVERCKETSPNV